MSTEVEDIKSRINIVDLIGEYVRLQKAGASWKACCPFHNEKTPSFIVSEEKQIWHCFGCQKGGDIFGFLMEIEGIEFREALRKLAEKAGVKLPEYRKEFTENKSKTLEILELSTKFYEKQLWEGAGKDKILNYLHDRGLKNEIIKEFRLGYAPKGWRNLSDFLTKRGYKIEEIIKTGLLVEKRNDQISNSPNYSNSPNQIPNPSDQNTNIHDTRYQTPATSYYDRFRDRIIFPIADVNSKIVGFSARVAPGQDESQAKYVNTPETEVYHKSQVLYGIDKAKREIKNKNFVLLVEGNMDVIAASQAGLKNTVAVSGTALASQQIDILKRYAENIKMFFDTDSAGTEAAKRSAEMCFQKDMGVFIVQPEFGKDAAEMANKNPQALVNCAEKAIPAMEYFFAKILSEQDKTKAEGKKIIAKEALNIIRNFSNEIEKSHWIKKLAETLEVEEKPLLDVLKKVELKRKVERSKEEKEKDFTFRSRAEIMREKIIGLMLSEKSVWEKMSESGNNETNSFLNEDGLFAEILEKGPLAGFEYENIIPLLGENEVKKAARHYFETRYQFGSQGEVQERNSENAGEQLDYYLGEIKKELCKEKLKTIVQDLKKAEKEGDKETVKFLMTEFSKISQDLK